MKITGFLCIKNVAVGSVMYLSLVGCGEAGRPTSTGDEATSEVTSSQAVDGRDFENGIRNRNSETVAIKNCWDHVARLLESARKAPNDGLKENYERQANTKSNECERMNIDNNTKFSTRNG